MIKAIIQNGKKQAEEKQQQHEKEDLDICQYYLQTFKK